MSGVPVRGRAMALMVETLFMAAIIAAFADTLIRSIRDGYLVQPFIYDTADTFMDWFNTAWWGAHESGAGAYEVWGSIYPPISFIFLRLTTFGSCYETDSAHARDCDWLGMTTMFTVFAIDMALVAYAYWRSDRRTMPMRFICILLGFPALHGLERGNLITVAFGFLFLAFSPVISSVRVRWVAAAIAINFKVYLISTMAVYFARRRWLSIEVTVALTILIYVFTYAIYGNGLPTEIITNILTFADLGHLNTWQDMYYATSLNSLTRLLDDYPEVSSLVGSDLVEWTMFVVPMIVRVGQLLCVVAIFATLIRPSSASVTRLVAISVSLAIMTSEAGGYSYLLVIAFVLFEPWKGAWRITALILAYLLSLTWDYVLSYAIFLNTFSWWAGHDVLSKYGIAVGQYLRPFGLIFMSGALSLHTIQTCLATLRRDLAEGRPILRSLHEPAAKLD